MEENLNKLVTALHDLVKELRDRTTAQGVTDSRMTNEDGFFDPLKEERDKNQDLVDKLTDRQEDLDDDRAKKEKKEQDKQLKKSKTPRKILQKVTSVNVVDISDKAIKKLSKIVPNSKLKKKLNEVDDKADKGPWSFLKKLGVGVFAIVVGPIVALIAAFQAIAGQRWFLALKKFVTESKFWGALKSFAGTIKGFFGGLGAKFPVLGKIFGKVSGVFGKVFGTIKSVGGTIFNLIQKTKIYTIASKIGKFIGSIFAPIIVLWGAIKTVMGAVKGYKEDGIAGALKGGINALFDFVIGDFAKILAAIPAWILDKLGLKNMAKSLKKNVSGIVEGIKNMFGGIIDTVVGVLTFDKERILKGLKGFMNGQADLGGWILGFFIDPAINFLKDIFKWGDPEEPFSFKEDVVDPVWKAVKDWFKKILSFGDTADGGWSLLKFVNTVEQKIKDFFIGMFTWGVTAGTNEQGEWSLGTFIGTVFENVKGWLVGMFSWVDMDVVWSLKDKVLETWNSVKGWFINLISWAESDTTDGVEDGFITGYVKGVVLTIKTWLGKLFTFDSTSSSITSVINIATWLPNLITTGLGKISEWFLRLFGFDEQADAVKEWNEKFSIGDLVVGAIKKVWEWFSGKFPNATEFLKKSWDTLTSGVADIGDFIWSGVKSAWNWLKKLWDNPKKTIENGWNNLTKNLKSLGDFIWTGLKSAWDWVKNIFADPKKVISDSWKSLVGSWKSVGSWVWSKISGIWDWFGDTFPDLKNWVSDKWNNLTTNVSNIGEWVSNKITGIWTWFTNTFPDLSKWITKKWNNLTKNVSNVGEWVGNKITSAWTSLTSLFKTGDTSSLIPEGLKDIGKFVWSKISGVWSAVTGVFDNIVNFDVKGFLKKKIKSTGGVVGQKVYEALYGDEDRLEESRDKQVQKTAKKLHEYGINPELAKKIEKTQVSIENRYGGDNIVQKSENVTDAVKKAIGKGEKLTIEERRLLIKAFREGGYGFKNTELSRQVGDVTKMSDNEAFKKIESVMSGLKKSEVWGADQVDDKYDEDLRLLGLAAAQQELNQNKSQAKIEDVSKYLESVRSIKLAGKEFKFDGTSEVNQESVEHLKKIYADQSATGSTLAASLKNLGVTPEKLQSLVDAQTKKSQELPSTNYKLQETKRLPALDTDNAAESLNSVGDALDSGASKLTSAASDIPIAGDAINSGTRQLREATGEQFPIPSSPYAWEYIKMAGENINTGSRELYEQSIEYQKAVKQKTSEDQSETKKLSERLDKMVNLMTETTDIQKKTLTVLQEHGLIDKQGNTIVNNGGNSTTVNNITTQSDIMNFRNQVIGRIQRTNKY